MPRYFAVAGLKHLALIAALSTLTAAPAAAQVEYGRWQKTDKCRPASPPVGPGRGGVRMPGTPGGKGATECVWEREVKECPRIRDKARHWIRCLVTGKQKSGYTIFPPLD
jgi:hypothetical protein